MSVYALILFFIASPAMVNVGTYGKHADCERQGLMWKAHNPNNRGYLCIEVSP